MVNAVVKMVGKENVVKSIRVSLPYYNFLQSISIKTKKPLHFINKTEHAVHSYAATKGCIDCNFKNAEQCWLILNNADPANAKPLFQKPKKASVVQMRGEHRNC